MLTNDNIFLVEPPIITFTIDCSLNCSLGSGSNIFLRLTLKCDMVDESTKYSTSIFSCYMSYAGLPIEYVSNFGSNLGVQGHATPIL
jgi:hypothetical protein